MRASAFCLVWFALAASAFADSEKSYVRAWAAAHEGKTNVRMSDGTRCDVVTPTHAVEVVFAARWQDAIGRALFHAAQLNKHAGIVLIVNGPADSAYRQRLETTITVFDLPIDVWEVGNGAAKPPA